MCLCSGPQRQQCFFTGRSCRGSRVIAALRSTQGFQSWTNQPLKHLREGKFTRGTFDFACLLESHSLHCDEWSRCRWFLDVKLESNMYISICVDILFVLRMQQDHNPRRKFTLIQHCWYWYCKYCIYSCIINTYVFIIHVLYIYVRVGKWFGLWLLLFGPNLSQFILNLLWNLKHFSLKRKASSSCKSGLINWWIGWSFSFMWGKPPSLESHLLCHQGTTSTWLWKGSKCNKQDA